MLLRPRGATAEVLVVRRHKDLAFMGGMWVFPGGTVCPADGSPAMQARIPGSRLHCPPFEDLHGNRLDVDTCCALAVAAYRETFEETGVLLAVAENGEHCHGERLLQLQEQRRAIVSQPELFATLVQEEHLRLDIVRLVYWAHWITPSVVPRRFDTRFFAVKMPPGQEATIDTVEAVYQAWMTPEALLRAATHEQMPISHPTLYNLMVLEDRLRLRGSLDAMLSDPTQHPVPPVLPKVIRGEPTVMVLPWDPEYHDLPGEGVGRETAYPPWLSRLPSRMPQRQ